MPDLIPHHLVPAAGLFQLTTACSAFKRNFTNGLQFQAAWTWSHTFDNSTADVFSTVLTPRRPQNFACFSCDYSTSALDRRHRVTLAADLRPAVLQERQLVHEERRGQLAVLADLHLPVSRVRDGADWWRPQPNGDSARPAFVTPRRRIRAGVTALTNSAGAGVAYVADNPNAQYVAAGPGRWSRNTLGTPYTNNWDFALLKRLNITERVASSSLPHRTSSTTRSTSLV